jgi:hypothetical protein
MCLSSEEDEPAAALIHRLRAGRNRGYLTASELEAVCLIASRHPAHSIQPAIPPFDLRPDPPSPPAANKGPPQPVGIRKGVAVPMASALLMLLDPERYGVIDIRAWQLLYETGTVQTNARGMGFTIENWLQYLTILRRLARKFRVSARDIGRALFNLHREHQEGRLYG